MNSISTVAVTGASGFVGREVVRELLARGYRVRALVRSVEKAGATLPTDARLELVEGNALQPEPFVRLVQGCQAVVHLVGIIREVREPGQPPQTFEGLHVRATQHAVQAARSAGVSRFIHMSAIGVSPDSKAEYARTKWEGEQIVRRSGLDWTVFRPGVIQGPSGELVAQVREMASGDVAPFFFLPFFARFEDHEEGVLLPRLTLEPAKLAPVSVVDVATAFAEALARPQTVGEVYNLSGPEVLNWRQFMEFMRDTLPGTDKGITVLPVPSTHAAVIATGAKYLGLAGLLPFDAGQAHMAGQDSDADLDKVRAHLGIEPRGFREDVRAWASAMPARA